MTDLHDQLLMAFNTYIKESEKFDENGVKVSAQRARQALTEVKALIVLRRKELQEQKDLS